MCAASRGCAIKIEVAGLHRCPLIHIPCKEKHTPKQQRKIEDHNQQSNNQMTNRFIRPPTYATDGIGNTQKNQHRKSLQPGGNTARNISSHQLSPTLPTQYHYPYDPQMSLTTQQQNLNNLQHSPAAVITSQPLHYATTVMPYQIPTNKPVESFTIVNELEKKPNANIKHSKHFNNQMPSTSEITPQNVGEISQSEYKPSTDNITPSSTQERLDLFKQSGAIPKNHTPRSLPLTLDLEREAIPQESTPPKSSHNAIQKITLKSPKVLFSCKSPGQGYYLKDMVAPRLKDAASTDSDQSSPELDRYLKNFNTGLEPLSPQEIKTYLCNLNKAGMRDRSVSPTPVVQTKMPSSRVCTRLSFNECEAKDQKTSAYVKTKPCRSLSPLTRQIQQYDEDCRNR